MVQYPRLRDSGEPSPFTEPNELGEGGSPDTQREGSVSQSFWEVQPRTWCSELHPGREPRRRNAKVTPLLPSDTPAGSQRDWEPMGVVYRVSLPGHRAQWGRSWKEQREESSTTMTSLKKLSRVVEGGQASR